LTTHAIVQAFDSRCGATLSGLAKWRAFHEDWVSAITAQQRTQKFCVPKLAAGLDNKG